MRKKLLYICLSNFMVVYAQQNSPNIIVILADDMGYSDLGCMGGEIETPNIDALANKGVIFSNFYTAPVSCASRATLLTGQYQWNVGVGQMNKNLGVPEYQGFLNNSCLTLAEALKLSGYDTFMSGKWHVGDKRECWPDKRGFDQFYGIPNGGGIHYYPSKHYNRTLYHNNNIVKTDSSWISTDGFTDAAISFLKERKTKNKPFFLYLAYIAPHFPLQAKERDVQKYLKKYESGYDDIRKGRISRQKKLNVIQEGNKVSIPSYPEWSTVINKEEEIRKMAVYAAMVDCIDQNIGKLIDTLKKRNLYDNTVIFFLSDNGGCMTNFNRTPDVKIGTRNSNATYGTWYNVSNTPLRGGKTGVYEGGIKNPLIIHWPSKIKRSRRINEISHMIDIMPTCLDIVDGIYPKTYQGRILSPLDGESILPLIHGNNTKKSKTYYFEYKGNGAIREDEWKLIHPLNKDWELYNLETDPFETENLITKYPSKVKKLKLKFIKWITQHKILPQDFWNTLLD